jgi:hypothetical protein
MNELKFEKEWGDKYVLLCPLCRSNFLHHEIVETFERNEDDKKGMHTIVTHEQVDVKYDSLDDNPSSRRNGLKIKFFCEQCQKKLPTLVLSQHKGQTMMGWDI